MYRECVLCDVGLGFIYVVYMDFSSAVPDIGEHRRGRYFYVASL